MRASNVLWVLLGRESEVLCPQQKSDCLQGVAGDWAQGILR